MNEKTINIDSTLLEKEDLCSELPISAMIAKTAVPFSHRRIADAYNIITKICGFQSAQPRITYAERSLLFKYHFNTLENSTIAQINNELILLKQLSLSTDDTTRQDSETLLNIRVKELKHILSNKYALSTEEIYNGYKAINVYLNEITNFYSRN